MSEPAAAAETSEIYTRDERTTSLAVRGGKVKGASVAECHGEAARVLVSGRLGVATRTGPVGKEGALNLLERARESATAGDVVGFGFPGPGEATADIQTFDPAVEALSPKTLQALARAAIERAGAAGSDVSADLDLRATVVRTRLENSSGLAVEEPETSFRVSLGLSLTLEDDLVNVYGEACSRSLSGVIDATVDRALEWLSLARKRAPAPATRAGRVLFAPGAVAALLDPFVSGLDGLEVALGASPLAYDLGEAVLDARLSLLDDGTAPGAPGASHWDGEGVLRQTVKLIDAGRLTSFYHDLRSAAHAGSASTGNGLRQALLPVRGPGNWVLQSSEPKPLAHLLGELGDGLLVVELLGVGQTAARDGAFSNPVALAFAVSGGEVVGRVSDVMVAGNAYDLLRDGLVAAADDSTWTFGLDFPLLTPSLLLDHVNITAAG